MAVRGAGNRRKDKDRVVLRKGESQRKDGKYDYRWTGSDGKRHSVYAKTLEELRNKEAEIEKNKSDGIRTEARNVTINDLFELWYQLKRGLKDNTFQNYKYMYVQFVEPDFGRKKVTTLKKSDVKRFYNMLANERGLKPATIDNVLKELKPAHNFDIEKRKALTVAEQTLFLDFLKKHRQYSHWYIITMRKTAAILVLTPQKQRQESVWFQCWIL